MDLEMTGRRAIVTGATGGIGRATAELFAEEGCHVGICARSEDGVRETVASLEGKGVRGFGQALDVADAAALRSWVEDAADALGGIDVVVANVSALGSGEGEEAWRRAFEVDLMHTVRTVEAARPHLERSDSAAIVIVSTVTAREPMGAAAYGTLKAALNHYGKALASEVAADGIRVNVVSPGTVYVEDGYWGAIEREDPDRFEHMAGMNPMGRMGRPDEIARSIVFLASPASSFTSGTNLLVDGTITNGVQM